jgi:hypothetical protein
MELTQGSETSANYNLTPGKYPKEYMQYSNHGESLKSRNLDVYKILLEKPEGKKQLERPTLRREKNIKMDL